MNTLHAGTANYAACDGGGQRLLFILTFRNTKAKEVFHRLLRSNRMRTADEY